MNKKLYVGNLLYEATEDQLRDLFSQAGEVVSAQVIRFADSGRSKGFAFIEMVDEAAAQKAIEMFNEYDFMGRKVIVNEARPKTNNDSRGRFDRNRRFGGGGHGDFDRGYDRDRGHDRGENRPAPEAPEVTDMGPQDIDMSAEIPSETPSEESPKEE
ncbi:hypothetical protein A3A93_05240 [Candidatus Roizmanbacteria bacterium RIFCSPLOWO2_01_FULL_38_12]|uniref:RRM domain-containing protein n=1 Tax=Candidatus Roizmanbacteria bacterium RIFCSPLOWO2_01_FULL_38_12 TaxID=1802061 RepID=A0A1F7IZ27_9BACT|nr:MAG: hypothetical protein A2861_03455 [Candidatus Roizmanbacteria bacterium RIFCSPHIGHO2_01_FULL_38_15]OGK35634.1 MAG: hypothetical protein A3F59_01670 [Candidatus Roizmanbacteria bacterium RIFCSPHIGHO2_12_FULL_38_13]OGK48601.1 MAG: hypothetical protein A3A93_05240 [Candidatus Roizmanbacteria bacterium RIFCSPLOWO2_01_FULL_38_12]